VKPADLTARPRGNAPSAAARSFIIRWLLPAVAIAILLLGLVVVLTLTHPIAKKSSPNSADYIGYGPGSCVIC
jgi:hypothetical protein